MDSEFPTVMIVPVTALLITATTQRLNFLTLFMSVVILTDFGALHQIRPHRPTGGVVNKPIQAVSHPYSRLEK
jgi:hypothetical protein